MSVKKNKRKVTKQNHQLAHRSSYPMWLRRHPKLFIGVGGAFILISILLITIGYVSHARVGGAMLSLFFGIAVMLYANAAQPKKSKVKNA